MTDSVIKRHLVIGLDMGDSVLIRQWAHDGRLPTFRRMMEQGAWLDLKTTADILHVSAWPSLYTGTYPGKHGVYYTYQPTKGAQTAGRIAPGQYGSPPLWNVLDSAGKPCVVLDAPYTFPDAGFKGQQIFEWGTWAWYWRPMSVPAGLLKELTRACGPYPLGFEANQIGLAALDREKLRDGLVRSAGAKAKAVQWLLKRNAWEFSWIVFGESHPAAHYLWSNPGGDEGGLELCRDVYTAIDRAVGEILADLDGDTRVFIVSGDGVKANRAGWHLLPQVLNKTGYLKVPDQGGGASGQEEVKKEKAGKDLLKRIRGLIPEDFRQMVSKRLPASVRDRLMARWAQSGVVWEETRAFCLPTDLEGCIRINLKGREPHGIVEPGREYDELCEQITEMLLSLTNQETAAPAVQSVHKVDEVFPGPKREDLPDLVVQWRDESSIETIDVPGIGSVSGISPDKRSGTHRAQGFLLASGEGIPDGHLPGSFHVVDLAPTLLALMGESIPNHMDGRVWREFAAGIPGM